MKIPFWDMDFIDIFGTKTFWIMSGLFFLYFIKFAWRIQSFDKILNFVLDLFLSFIVSAGFVTFLFACYFGVRFIIVDFFGYKSLMGVGNYY